MKKIGKRIISTFMVLLMLIPFANISSSAASTYYPDLAVKYAEEHWNDGVGLCAEYVSNCLKAGGCGAWSTVVSTLRTSLINGGYGTDYVLTKGSKYATASSNTGKVSAGDPIFFYCNTCGKYKHAGIITGTDSNGYLYYCAHNGAQHNENRIGWFKDNCEHSGSCITVHVVHMNNIGHTLTVNYYSNYANSAGKSVTASIGSDKNVFVRSYEAVSGTCTNFANYGLLNYTNGDWALYRTGYSGTGYWNTKTDGTGYRVHQDNISYDTGAKMAKALGVDISTSDKTVNLYPEWKANTYTVTFNANGGSCSTASKSVIYDSKCGTLPTPTRYGYSFDGWYTAVSGGTKLTADTVYNTENWYTTSGNTTLYARWIPNTNTIYFNANGGSCSTASKSVIYDSKCGTLPTPTRYGYSFDGWYTAVSGGTKLTADTIYNTENWYTTSGNTTLYAHWKANTYTVTFNANGGSCSTSTKSVTYASTYGTLPTPTKNGYSFAGWYTATSGGTQITSSTKVSITSNQTLYAVWKSTTCSHTYDSGTITKNASCTETGIKTYKCTKCGAEKTEIIPMVEHSYGAWVVTKSATTTEEGTETRTCTKCKHTETRSIAKISTNVKEETLNINYKEGFHFTGDQVVEVVSSNPNVVVVNNDKSVTAVNSGTADITATFEDGSQVIVHVNVTFAWWQTIIILLLFGWIWY